MDRLTAKASVPHKIRKQLTAAAQFIENFKHRKTVKAAMTEAFAASGAANAAASLFWPRMPALPLIVHAWYDDLPQAALAGTKGWGMVQGVSQAEHFGDWVHYFDGATLARAEAADAEGWAPLLYQPLGSVSPAANYLVSDSDFVEVLTEIDIQTPVPEAVQNIRKGRHFLFLGCRFSTQLERIFAQQIIKALLGPPLGGFAGDAHAQRGALPRRAQHPAHSLAACRSSPACSRGAWPNPSQAYAAAAV